MKILAKLITGFLVVALLCGVVGILGISQMSNLGRSIDNMSGQSIPAVRTLYVIKMEMLNVKVAIRSITNPMGLDDEVYIARQKSNIASAREKYAAAIAEYEKLTKVPEEKRLWDLISAGIPKVKAYNDNIVNLSLKAVDAKKPADRTAILDQVYTQIAGDQRLVFDNFLASVDDLINYDIKYYTVEIPAKAQAAASASRVILIGVTITSFLAAVILGLILGSSISKSLSKAALVLNKVAAGDLSERLEIKSKDEFQELSRSVNTCIANIKLLADDANMLAQAAVEGKLATRADATRHQGDYRKIVDGVNKTLDSVIGPLNVAASYVDQISRGAIPQKITDSYYGDFNVIKNNLNTCIDSVNALVADATLLVQAALDGKLTTRADATKHQGDYRKIVEGVNQTLDLVITPINETTAILKHLAEGDLTQAMNGQYKGDFDVLKASLNDSLGSINEILGQVSVAVEQVSAGSLQVSQASQSLSQGATEQASSLEEITSSITEVASQTKLNTENAVQVNALAKTAKVNAEQGNVQMQDLVAAMSDINSSAEEIRKIVKAIDDISFQINLLALNANVEAARAGKYGKGFAVVAEEVRNLAVRSANSVKETTRMVDEAIANITRGNGLVDVTAKQLAAIVSGAAQVATLAEDVSTASKEQALGLEQISTGLNQIDQVTQANTASAEESAAAAEELSSQSQQLKATLAKFKLKEQAGKASNAEVLQLLRMELAKQSGAKHAGAGGGHLPSARKSTGINPAELISLDDDNFGKF